MSKIKEDIQGALMIGFILSGFSVLFPYLFDHNHVNEAKWHPAVQWLVLWIGASGVIFCFERISRINKKHNNNSNNN